MARASAVKMPPEANAAHGCEGARRVLALMLTFSADEHTLTARQLAERTGIETENDRRIVKQPQWSATVLQPGARLEIVQFVGGG